MYERLERRVVLCSMTLLHVKVLITYQSYLVSWILGRLILGVCEIGTERIFFFLATITRPGETFVQVIFQSVMMTIGYSRLSSGALADLLIVGVNESYYPRIRIVCSFEYFIFSRVAFNDLHWPRNPLAM